MPGPTAGAVIIRVGFWGILYCTCNEEHQNSIGSILGPDTTEGRDTSQYFSLGPKSPVVRKTLAPALTSASTLSPAHPTPRFETVWRRRLRFKRQRTRRQLKRGGQPPRLRVLQLGVHHSANPTFRRRLAHMGKAGTNQARAPWSTEQWSDLPSCSVWPGAWRTRECTAVSTRPYEVSLLRCRVDRRRTGTHRGVTATRYAAEPAACSLVGVVQKAVNVPRKTEAKVNRLKKEQHEKATRWGEYQQKMKEAYNKEKARHERDQARLTTDLATAIDEQEQAHQLVFRRQRRSLRRGLPDQAGSEKSAFTA